MSRQSDLVDDLVDELRVIEPRCDVATIDALDALACLGWVARDDCEQSDEERCVFATEFVKDLRSNGFVGVTVRTVTLALRNTGLALTQMAFENEASAAYFDELTGGS